MPDGADAVVMVEDTDGSREGVVRIRRRARSGQHVRPRADDVAAGQVVLEAGRCLTPGCVGLAGSVGCATLPVRRRPVVAVLTTGDEVVRPGEALGPGQIYSSNTYALCALAREAGAVPVDRGNAPDDLAVLLADLRAAADSGADAIVTTGGVSVGAFDLVKEAMGAAGAEMDFWKVRMKPGKPLAFGRVGRVPIFGLPGNPVSCMVNFLQFVRPWIRLAQGDPRPYLPVVDAVLVDGVRVHPGRAKLERVALSHEDGHLVARLAPNQSSGVLMSMVLAHGLLLLGEQVEEVPPGGNVRVQVFDAGFLAGASPGYGW
jgi:molybdopterin molybdotransferase